MAAEHYGGITGILMVATALVLQCYHVAAITTSKYCCSGSDDRELNKYSRCFGTPTTTLAPSPPDGESPSSVDPWTSSSTTVSADGSSPVNPSFPDITEFPESAKFRWQFNVMMQKLLDMISHLFGSSRKRRSDDEKSGNIVCSGLRSRIFIDLESLLKPTCANSTLTVQSMGLTLTNTQDVTVKNEKGDVIEMEVKEENGAKVYSTSGNILAKQVRVEITLLEGEWSGIGYMAKIAYEKKKDESCEIR